MEQIRSLSQLIEEATKLCAEKGRKRISVAMAEDAGLISAIEDARKMGLVDATLVGNPEKIKACIAEAGASEAKRNRRRNRSIIKTRRHLHERTASYG